MMMLQAVPEAQREELVSAKRLTAMKVLCHLLVTYQPGGLAEKEVFLSNLENPPEAQTVPDATARAPEMDEMEKKSR